MTPPAVTKLSGVHPELVAKVTRILYAMSELGFPMLVTDGLRTTEQQRALFAQGRTAMGRIVTYADGDVKKSNHQAKADGYGWAVDCAFLVDGRPSWDDARPWDLYGCMARALGLTWGGTFVRLVDRPHIEIKDPR